MRILILNTHSILNSGDSGIFLSEMLYLKNFFSGCNLQIAITSRTPEIDKIHYGLLDVEVLHPLIPSPSLITGNVKKFKYIIKNIFNLKDKLKLIKIIQKSDLIISSGGGYFYTYRKFFPGPMFIQNYLPIIIANIFKKPVLFSSQSFGPIKNNAGIFMLHRMITARNVINIFVREKKSMGFLKSLVNKTTTKINFCPDMAFFLQPDTEIHYFEKNYLKNVRRPVVAFTLRQWNFPDLHDPESKFMLQENYLKSMAVAAKEIIERLHGSVIIFPQVRGPGSFEDDRIISKKFEKRLENYGLKRSVNYLDFEDSINPLEIIDILKSIDLIISTRFHAAIFSFLASKPVLAIAYQQKSIGIMETMGLKNFCLNIEDINAEKLMYMVNEILRDYEELVLKIKDAVEFTKMNIKTTLDSAFYDFKKSKYD